MLLLSNFFKKKDNMWDEKYNLDYVDPNSYEGVFGNGITQQEPKKVLKKVVPPKSLSSDPRTALQQLKERVINEEKRKEAEDILRRLGKLKK